MQLLPSTMWHLPIYQFPPLPIKKTFRFSHLVCTYIIIKSVTLHVRWPCDEFHHNVFYAFALASCVLALAGVATSKETKQRRSKSFSQTLDVLLPKEKNTTAMSDLQSRANNNNNTWTHTRSVDAGDKTNAKHQQGRLPKVKDILEPAITTSFTRLPLPPVSWPGQASQPPRKRRSGEANRFPKLWKCFCPKRKITLPCPICKEGQTIRGLTQYRWTLETKQMQTPAGTSSKGQGHLGTCHHNVFYAFALASCVLALAGVATSKETKQRRSKSFSQTLDVFLPKEKNNTAMSDLQRRANNTWTHTISVDAGDKTNANTSRDEFQRSRTSWNLPSQRPLRVCYPASCYPVQVRSPVESPGAWTMSM